MYACAVNTPDDRQADAAAPDAAEPQPMDESPRSHVGLRLLGAAVTIPWLFAYGVTGVWAVTRGARSAAGHLSSIDVGYSRTVSPTSVIFVGALLLAGFAVMLAAAMLVLYGARGPGRWAAVCLVATALTVGSVWVSVRGELHPAMWPVFFGGLLYATLLSLIMLVRALRARGGSRIVDP